MRGFHLLFCASMTLAGFAGVGEQTLDWKLCKYATREGDVLTVEVPVSESNRTYMCTATVDLAPFENKAITVSARVWGSAEAAAAHPERNVRVASCLSGPGLLYARTSGCGSVMIIR